jgi:glutaredoxin
LLTERASSAGKEKEMEQKTVTVYTQPGWPPCKQAKESLSRRGIAFTERDLTRDPAAMDELRRMGVMGTPAIVVGDQVMVGFDEEHLDQLLGARPANQQAA